MAARKNIALAHDNKKKDLSEWAEFNRGLLVGQPILLRAVLAESWQTGSL
jgi:methylglyoxal synthase